METRKKQNKKEKEEKPKPKEKPDKIKNWNREFSEKKAEKEPQNLKELKEGTYFKIAWLGELSMSRGKVFVNLIVDNTITKERTKIALIMTEHWGRILKKQLEFFRL